MLKGLLVLLFPPKCVLCRKILAKDETDLCHKCRMEAPEFIRSKFQLSFVAGWTAVWYYKDNVRQSLLRYKFSGVRSYGEAFGRFLAMKVLNQKLEDFDVLTWVPVGPKRLRKRGYDQVALIARQAGIELQQEPVRCLRKIKDTPPQSGMPNAASRRANVLGAYVVTDPKLVADKRILLLDDIITTGATASECARVLLTAGAKEVYCAAVAAATHDKKR